ncbi:MAG: hypothetical protein WA633_04345 [Stellaceae bacterium]
MLITNLADQTGRQGGRERVRSDVLFSLPHCVQETAFRQTEPELLKFDQPLKAEPIDRCEHEHNLPIRLTRLIGRASTVSRLVGQLQRQRLLKIVGPGGIGKTSVALAVAEELVATYEHGVWLIDLAPLDHPRLLAPAFAAALELDFGSENPLPT